MRRNEVRSSSLTIKRFRISLSRYLPPIGERMKTMRLLHKVPFPLAAIFVLVAGGLTQVLAQPRYSANFVGYRDADFFAGSNLVANPFDAGNNTLSNLFAGVPSGSYFLHWNPLS